MNDKKVQPITIKDARIVFRNFKGAPDTYNSSGGVRTFAIVFDDPTLVANMISDGWNIRYLKPREEGEAPTPYVSVKVNYSVKPPRIYLVTGDTKRLLSESEIHLLDSLEAERVDLTLSPYVWTVNDNTGVKAYLRSMYFTMRTDDLDMEYADKAEIGAEPLRETI